ncbi:acidic fibroblast growth factor intracellular-binding protein isoform X1 [Teleopsis dalmanni]|uniref:acidic fibroblast growth factor intracellular-binding protein isoform X1 n=2 Tax=Teleopsis dalmanni TaxID=139649 RepID=UPI0018CD3A68|nr:acidic fibroblast growth factor intracellular-binding protein isoform X1 [Teleopsis dalmanni]
MLADVDVFISNYTLVDPEIYQLFIEGFSSSEAVCYMKQKGFVQFLGAPIDLIASDILDHYRTYSLIERLLHAPTKLLEQSCFQLEPNTRDFIIEKYYSIDDAVAREILGKKLSSRYRKDLDEVAEKTGAKLKSCRRQFDNVKRIFKIVEELPGNITNNIKQHFNISDELAKKYATIVFLACLRFETSKKKLQYLTFADLFACSQAIMIYWTYTYQHTGPEYYDTEMDKEFLLDLRELRCLLDKEKEIKHLVCMRLKPVLLERSFHELDANFRSYWRALITIACNLHRTRELRDLFLDLCEKLVEPWRQNGWTREQVNKFLSAITQGVLDLEISRDQETRCLWDRYMQVISICLDKMYHI